ncbi:MAG: hypothetical protein LLG02_07455 [Pelosinus sp.]|nr:hypothetical protein [Pelosinus sp.]
MGNTLYRIVNWETFKLLIEKNFKIVFRTIDDLFVNKPELHQWEKIEESEIFDILSKLRSFSGTLLVITDVSYRSNFGPFEIDANNFQRFIDEHYRNFGEPFLDTDIIIVSIEFKLAWVIHHEGVYALVNMS